MIRRADASTAVFLDRFARGPVGIATAVDSFADFEHLFGGLVHGSDSSYQVLQFFQNGGRAAQVIRAAPGTPGDLAAALRASLSAAAPFPVVCIPPTASLSDAEALPLVAAAQEQCKRHRSFLVIDVPPSTRIPTPAAMVSWWKSHSAYLSRPEGCAAIYYPRLTIADPLEANRPREIGASGAVAGIYARTDIAHGVWKQPAGEEATVQCATPVCRLTDVDLGALTPLRINSIREVPGAGLVVWGAKTVASHSEWKYVNIRRLAFFIESSIDAGLKWAAFEPNGSRLRAKILSEVAAFLDSLWRQGGLLGNKPEQAYYVRCDSPSASTVAIDVGYAPLRPAEFVVLKMVVTTGAGTL
jgi:phage tail sheath protein FI